MACPSLPTASVPRDATPVTVLSEQDAAVLLLPPNACGPFTDWQYILPLVKEANVWRLLGVTPDWPHESKFIELLCADRAQRTVDGQLTVKGRTVKPETYLKRWRVAINEGVPVDQAPAVFGLRPQVRFAIGRDLLPEACTTWRDPPEEGFAGLMAKYLVESPVQAQTQVAGENEGEAGHARVHLLVDLCLPDGPHDAWWIQSYFPAWRLKQRPFTATVVCTPVSA